MKARLVFELHLKQQTGYAEPMSRILSVSSIILLSLLPAIAFGAAVHKRHAWHGYGFLPGYHQPPNNSVPVYRFEGIKINPRHSGRYPKLLVQRRLELLRRAQVFPRTLQWRQFRPMLDLDADRAHVE